MKKAGIKTLGAFVALAAIAIAAEPAPPAEDSCLPFSGSILATSPVADWVGEGWYVFGTAEPLRAKVLVVNTGYEKAEGDVWIGTETATLDFGNGDSFQLLTRFLTEHMNSETGVYRVTETATVRNGTGRFKNANGLLTHVGSFGPGLSADGQTWLWTGEYRGAISGVDAKDFKEKTPRATGVSRSRDNARR